MWRRYRLAVRTASVLVAAATAVVLIWTGTAGANGDPASDYLLVDKVFLPFNARPDTGSVKALQDLLDAAAKQGFPIRVAVILRRNDLGTAFSLFNKPQRYAEFLGMELSFLYKERLLVVMPEGFGYAVNGDPRPAVNQVLSSLPAPGDDATKEVDAAIVAVERIARSEGKTITVAKSSATRDRLTIAAVVLAALAVVAGVLMYRRRSAPTQT
jgi:hypothetical protein